jgi:threonine synthase
MDVGSPSNFERMLWLYHGEADAMRRDIVGCRYTDDDVRATIKAIADERGYLLDPHSAIAYRGATMAVPCDGSNEADGGLHRIFLATAHPAKFAEVVEPIVGRAVEKPAPLAQALSRPRHIIRIEATLDAVKEALGA